MAHYAFLNQENVVVDVIVGRDEDDLVEGITSWEDHYSEVRGMRCLRTSFNTWANIHWSDELDEDNMRIPSEDQSKAFRGNYAGIGYTYDEERDAFIPPKIKETDIFNEVTLIWDDPEEVTDEPEG
jgi:hypothetical protein